jgi:hypothetical protein
MPKHISGAQAIFYRAVSLVRSCFFVFLGYFLSSIKLFLYTYTRAYTRGRIGGNSKFKSSSLITAFILFVLAVSFGYNLVHPATSFATTSDTLNFQARLESSSGAIAPDGNYNIEFKLYNAASGGTALWTEDYLNSGSDSIAVSDGYLSVNLGSVTSFPSTIPWDQQLYLTMNIGGTGSSPTWDGEMNPRLLLTAVPYAFQAQNAIQLQQTSGSNAATLGFASPPTTNIAVTLPDTSGTVCLESSTNCGFAASSGASGYIQNGLSLQTGTNLSIQSVATSSVTASLKDLSSQTADLLSFIGSAGGTLGGINSNGQLYLQSGSYTGTIAQSSLTSGDATYDLPNFAGTQTICTVESGNCAGSGGGVTDVGTTINSLAVFNGSNTLRDGSIYDNGSGNVQIGNSTYSSPTSLLSVGSANQLSIDASGDLSTSGSITSAGLTNGGSTHNNSCNVGTNGTFTLTASSTVDNCTYITISDTTNSSTITVPSPTVSTAGMTTYISDISSATVLYLTAGGNSIPMVDHTTVTLIWDGTSWSYAGTGYGNIINESTSTTAQQGTNFNISGTGQAAIFNATTGFQDNGTAQAGYFLRGDGTDFVSSQIQSSDIPAGSSYYVQNQNSSAQTSTNFWISGTGTAATKLQAPAIDADTSGALQIGLSSGGNATSIVVNQDTTFAPGVNIGYAASGSTHSLSVNTQTTSDAAGDELTISAGNANGATIGSIGGDLNLNAGNAAGSANNNGGNVNISGGTSTGTGTAGNVVLQGTNSGKVGIGTLTPGNTLEIDSGSANTSGLQFGQLTSSSTTASANGLSLSVDSSGNVILTNIPSATIVGTLDGGTSNTNAATISSGYIYLQSASVSYPGVVNTTTQSFSGDKTFSGSLSANLTVSGNVALCADSLSSPTAGTYTFTECSGAPTADYAEAYPVVAGASYGDIVATGTNMVNTYGQDANGNVDYTNVIGQVTQLVKTTSPYQSNTIGVISNNNGDFSSTGHNIKSSDNPMAVALNGRVPVNIDPNSSPIQPGDYITTSDVAGLGTKATGAGFVIGKALGSWSYSSGQTSVIVYIEPGFYPGPDATSYLQNGGNGSLDNLSVTGTADFANLNASGTTNINNLQTITETISGNLDVQGITTITDLQISGHIVTSGTTPVAAATANAGDKAVCSVAGDDTSGQITITTGSGNWQNGAQCSINFSSPYTSAPHPVISLSSGPGSITDTNGVSPYVSSSTTGFQILFSAADSAQHTYIFNYFNAQ